MTILTFLTTLPLDIKNVSAADVWSGSVGSNYQFRWLDKVLFVPICVIHVKFSTPTPSRSRTLLSLLNELWLWMLFWSLCCCATMSSMMVVVALEYICNKKKTTRSLIKSARKEENEKFAHSKRSIAVI